MACQKRGPLHRSSVMLSILALIVSGVGLPRAASARPSLAELQTALCRLYELHSEPLPAGMVSECLDGKLVFVSSAVYTGNLGGLAGADAKCNALASAVGIPGTFKAWLSDTNAGPDTRFVHASVPYRLLDQTVIAVDWTDLLIGDIGNPIALDELGTYHADFAWTNTNADGSPQNGGYPFPSNCSDWTSDYDPSGLYSGAIGKTDSYISNWTSWGADSCAASHRLYCFEQ